MRLRNVFDDEICVSPRVVTDLDKYVDVVIASDGGPIAAIPLTIKEAKELVDMLVTSVMLLEGPPAVVRVTRCTCGGQVDIERGDLLFTCPTCGGAKPLETRR